MKYSHCSAGNASLVLVAGSHRPLVRQAVHRIREEAVGLDS